MRSFAQTKRDKPDETRPMRFVGGAIALSIVLLALPRCDLVGAVGYVEVIAPELPYAWEDVGDGIALSVVVESESVAVVSPGESVLVPTKAGAVTPVLLEPSLRGKEGLLRPASAVVSGDAFVHEATWELGPVGHTLRAIERAGYPLEAVNHDRLADEMADRAGIDAWAVDLTAVAAAIVAESMNVFYLNPRSPVAVKIETGPEAANSAWFSGDPLRPGPFYPTDGYLELHHLGPGAHAIINPARERYIRLNVDAGGRVRTVGGVL